MNPRGFAKRSSPGYSAAPGQFTPQQSTVHYYDGTQQTSEQTFSAFSLALDTRHSTVGYSCDLLGRMTGTAQTTFGADGVAVSRRDTNTFRYDDAGFRVHAYLSIETADETGTLVTRRTEATSYLADRDNFTGYTQVLREQLQSSGSSPRTVVYTLGLDVIGQWSSTSYTPFEANPVGSGTLAYTAQATTGVLNYITDGHGSVRGLLQVQNFFGTAGWGYTGGAILNRFTYDAYGNALGFNPLYAGTTHLYSGEQFDPHIQKQFLRARWYDPNTGRFQSLDPFAGSSTVPVSFHKYAYAYGDPVNSVDPTGWDPSLASLSVSGTAGMNGGISSGNC